MKSPERGTKQISVASAGEAGQRAFAPFSRSGTDDHDRVQIRERLAWSAKQRLDYLVDMLAFEERAHRARRI